MKKFLLLLLFAIFALCMILMVLSPREAAAPTAAPDTEITEDSTVSDAVGFRFSTTALDGSPVDESILRGKQVIMINFWESWCGPCVNEMPDLQKLYDAHADEGFLILGVFSTESGVKDVSDALAIRYPLLRFCDEFAPFQTGYVPTTIFMDGSGKLLLEEPVVGSRSYEDWDALVHSLLA